MSLDWTPQNDIATVTQASALSLPEPQRHRHTLCRLPPVTASGHSSTNPLSSAPSSRGAGAQGLSGAANPRWQDRGERAAFADICTTRSYWPFFLYFDRDGDLHADPRPRRRRACSRAFITALFQQLRTAHRDMLRAYAKQNPSELAALSHFLMGSAAALSIVRLSHTCQQIEHHGAIAADLDGADTRRAEVMATVGTLLGWVEGECVDAERWPGWWYQEEG